MAATRRGAEAVSLVMEVGGFSRIMVFINTHHPDGFGWGVQSAVNKTRCKPDRPPVSCERPQACPTLVPIDTKAKGRGRGANQGRKSDFHKIATVCSW